MSWRPPFRCPTPSTCQPGICTGGCGDDPPVVERSCVLCGGDCVTDYAVPVPVKLIGEQGTAIQDLPSYWCESSGGFHGSDVVLLDGWALVADHTVESWLVKLGTGAAEPAYSWKMWRDESMEVQVVIVQPVEHLRAVRLWFTDEYQRARGLLVPLS